MPLVQTTKVYATIEQAVKSGYTTISLQGSALARRMDKGFWLRTAFNKWKAKRIEIKKGLTSY